MIVPRYALAGRERQYHSAHVRTLHDRIKSGDIQPPDLRPPLYCSLPLLSARPFLVWSYPYRSTAGGRVKLHEGELSRTASVVSHDYWSRRIPEDRRPFGGRCGKHHSGA